MAEGLPAVGKREAGTATVHWPVPVASENPPQLGSWMLAGCEGGLRGEGHKKRSKSCQR